MTRSRRNRYNALRCNKGVPAIPLSLPPASLLQRTSPPMDSPCPGCNPVRDMLRTPPDGLRVPGGAYCSEGSHAGPLTAAPCARGVAPPAATDGGTAPAPDALLPVTYTAGCHGGVSGTFCDADRCRERVLRSAPASSPLQATTFKASLGDRGWCTGASKDGSGTTISTCCCTVDTYASQTSWTVRDACCRNDGSALACHQLAVQGRGSGQGELPPSLVDGGGTPVSDGGAPPGALLACAPEHCWASSDACDDAMARVALTAEPDPQAYCLTMYLGAEAGFGPPPSCTYMTSSSPTGATVRAWRDATAAAGGLRTRWSDWAALQHCNDTPGDLTCACLGAETSAYVDPVLQGTYAQLVDRLNGTFGAATVIASGVLQRKACWWGPCTVGAGGGAFLQTSAIAAQQAGCPDVNVCVASVQGLDASGDTPSTSLDLVCIIQNCSDSKNSDPCAAAAAAAVVAAGESNGALPVGTGSICSSCNDAINAALTAAGHPATLPPSPAAGGSTGGGSGSKPSPTPASLTSGLLMGGAGVAFAAGVVALVGAVLYGHAASRGEHARQRVPRQ